MMLKKFLAGSLIAISALTFTSAPSFAAPTTEPAHETVSTVTRVYDISDLLWQKQNYPLEVSPDLNVSNHSSGGGQGLYGGGGGGGDGSPATQPAQDHPEEHIISLLVDTVSPESWKDNGGTEGSIRELAGQLIVTHTPDAHRRIQEILQALRVDRGRMVVVRAYWLMLDPASVPQLGNSLPSIDDKLIDAKSLYCGAQTTCFNGQTVHVTSGRTRNLLVGLTPVVGSQSVGYMPTMEPARSGVALQMTPHLEPEGADARVVVDLHSSVSESGDVPPRAELPSTTQPADTQNTIERKNQVSQELRTTVRIPLGKKILVGGMTLEPAAREESAKQLYLVIEANAVR